MGVLEEKIKKFLAVPGSGDGSGDGSGYGSGDGYGSGYGDGYGYGYGYGYGDGSGYGYGDGDGSGVKEFDGKKVYKIDNVPTIIVAVHNSYAIGRILNKDLTLTPCYIAKVGNSFAHGDTLKKAFEDAKEKELENMPLEKRIENFRNEFPDADTKIPARKLYDWHHILTGSCQMGRDSFAKDHGINVYKDAFTVREFVNLTIQSYGSASIKQLAEAYGITIND